MWLRSFTRGRWHVVIDAPEHGQRAGQLVTLCAIPVPDYEYEQIRDGFTSSGFGCLTCHLYLGCKRGHELGWCPDTCPCPCNHAILVDRACADCYFPGPLVGDRGGDGLLFSACPKCGARGGPHREQEEL